MCSFLVTNKKNFDIDYVNHFLQKRGPDCTNYYEENNFLYLHNLLSITGDLTKQPLKKDGLVLVYNGEIYNYRQFGDYSSDGLCIIDLFQLKGTRAFQELDGEFSIVLHDNASRKIYICTDTFGTKPLFYALNEKEIGVCSYSSGLSRLGFHSITKCKPNQITVIDEITMKVTEEIPLYQFDLNQYKKNYDDWEISFIESVKKRSQNTNHSIVVPMSSGHDSGLICCILNEMNVNYVSVSVRGRENQEVLEKRYNIKKGEKHLFDSISLTSLNQIKNIFEQDVERFFYGPNPESHLQDGFSDQGAIGLYFVLKESKEKNNCKVVLSGQGSDEMMTNIKGYGFQTSNPVPFPEDLKLVFPWGNFYQGSQSSYLMKEECIAGSLGMESRYPFLDRKVVQEFLWLSADLKNSRYKGPIENSFKKRDYPFFEGKMGFNIGL